MRIIFTINDNHKLSIENPPHPRGSARPRHKNKMFPEIVEGAFLLLQYTAHPMMIKVSDPLPFVHCLDHSVFLQRKVIMIPNI